MKSYISIDGWRSNIRFSAAHIIHEYEKCGRLHGHTYAVHAKIYGKTDSKGIILDFSILKEKLRSIVNELDHRVLIPKKSEIAEIKKEGKNLCVTALGNKFNFPLENCVFLPIKSTSAENLSSYILTRLLEIMDIPKNVDSVEIGVDEGFGQGAKINKNL